jgi:TRAP-type C4-dicarboxylate transport system permease small subunit
MKRLLAILYEACGWLAGLAMAAMLTMIVLNIAGGQFGFFIRGLDSYAGYLMASSIFLALPYTLKAGEHIRVTLLLDRFGLRAKRGLEIACHVIACVFSGLLALACIRLVWLSWQFEELSQSQDATPLWIPQAPFAFGAVMLFVAFVEELVDELRGVRQAPSASPDGPARVE